MDKFKIGHINKTHRIEGQVILYLDYDIKKLPLFLFVEIDGTFIPYKISQYVHHDDKMIVAFEDINNKNEASMLVKRNVYIEITQVNEFVNPLFHYDVIDKTNGNIGIITDIEMYPMNQCLVIKNRDNEKILVPNVYPIVTSVDNETKTVYIDFPNY